MSKVFLSINNWLYGDKSKLTAKYDIVNVQMNPPKADAKPLDFKMHLG